MKWIMVIVSALCLALGTSCDDHDRSSCDPMDENYDPRGCPCDPTVADSCPANYVCRPGDAGAVCEPSGTAGRIPSCLDANGIDVFVAEANGALSVTWTVHAGIDFAGGFVVHYGPRPGDYQGSVMVGPTERQALLRPLDNDASYFVVVEALDAGGGRAFLSCEVEAVPHVLAFHADARVNGDTAGDQTDPDLASNYEGSRLYLAWEDAGPIGLAVSTNFGDNWTETAPVADSGENPAVAVRSEVKDEEGTIVTAERTFIVYEQSGQLKLRAFAPVEGTFDAALDVATGANADIDVRGDSIHIAFEDAGTIHHVVSADAGMTFGAPTPLSGTLTNAAAPSVAVDDLTGDVFVAWHAIEGAGDSNVYMATSTDAGASFGEHVRVDDDMQGQNQTNISIAIDEPSGRLYATWEDRRGGANVFFAFSEDRGQTWAPNVDVGVGLGGDQFRPRAVIDVASNVYVVFHDTTNGQRVVFSRFNEMGTFDPPLEPSTKAGAEGVVGDYPTVATDRYGAVYVAWQENRGGADNDIFFARAE